MNVLAMRPLLGKLSTPRGCFCHSYISVTDIGNRAGTLGILLLRNRSLYHFANSNRISCTRLQVRLWTNSYVFGFHARVFRLSTRKRFVTNRRDVSESFRRQFAAEFMWFAKTHNSKTLVYEIKLREHSLVVIGHANHCTHTDVLNKCSIIVVVKKKEKICKLKSIYWY